MMPRSTVVLGASLVMSFALASRPNGPATWNPNVPRVWDEKALQDWATPLAGLNFRPGHISALEYYRVPVEDLRSYPVYYPGREPTGYWEMLQRIGPQQLFEPNRLKTESDWIAAGRRVFGESDAPQLRTWY